MPSQTPEWRSGELSELDIDGVGLLTDSENGNVYNFALSLVGNCGSPGEELGLPGDGTRVWFTLTSDGVVDVVELDSSLLRLNDKLRNTGTESQIPSVPVDSTK